MYFATGYGLIQTVKALMSYDDKVRSVFMRPVGCEPSLQLQRARGWKCVFHRACGSATAVGYVAPVPRMCLRRQSLSSRVRYDAVP
jgi:hypothetical protein